MESKARIREEARRDGVKALMLVNHIANMLDGTEWNADTCNTIAELLRDNGFTIGEPREETEQ
jgi:hypothetical protein